MATLAGELRQGLRGALALLQPFPGRMEFAGRLALICALTTLVAEIYQTPDPALTAYVAFFVMKRDRMESIVISMVLAILISLIVGMLIPVAMNVIDEPLWRVTSIALSSFCLLFLASASKLRPIGAIVALITGYALDLLSKAQIGELATRGYLYAWLFVTIPAAVSIVVNLLLGPPPRRLLEQALAHRLALAAALMRAPDQKVREAFGETLSEGVAELQTWLKMASIEKTSPPEDIAALGQATGSITTVLLLVDLADRAQQDVVSFSLRSQIGNTLELMAKTFQAGGYPVDIAIDHDGDGLLPVAATLLADLQEVLRRFTERPLPDLPAAKPAAAGFFLPDAFINPDHVYYALKTTAAAMFCYAIYSLLDWPGIHTSLITCYIVSLGTTAETVEKLTLRILGCLVGAGAGIGAIVFLMPHVTSIGGLMIVVFAAAFVSAWVAAGSPRISYVGFQIAFAFFLCVVQGSSPAFDLTVARDRIIGILFGNIVVYLMFTNIWPVTVTRRIDPALVSLLHRLRDLTAGATSRSRRNALATEAAGVMGAITQDIELARYEPPEIRPPRAWLAVRLRAIHQIRALMGPLLLLANMQPSPAQAVGRRLDILADDLSGGPELTAPPSENSLPADKEVRKSRDPSTVDGLVMADLDGLESALHGGDGELAGHASA